MFLRTDGSEVLNRDGQSRCPIYDMPQIRQTRVRWHANMQHVCACSSATMLRYTNQALCSVVAPMRVHCRVCMQYNAYNVLIIGWFSARASGAGAFVCKWQ